MGFYVESHDRPYRSALAGEDILVGLLVDEQADGTVEVVDDTSTRWDGVADVNHRGGYIADELDESSDFTYKAAATNYLDRLVKYGGKESDAIVRVRTIIDPEDVDDDALSMPDGTVVGVAQIADADYHGRVIQEGYSDGAATYDRASGNFIPVGVTYGNTAQDYETAVGYDDLVRVRVDLSL